MSIKDGHTWAYAANELERKVHFMVGVSDKSE